jgi:hypothetical protein
MDIGCWVFDIGHWVMPTEARPGGRWAGVGSIQAFFPGNDYRPFPRGRPFVVGAVSWDRVMGRGGGGARYKVFVRNNYRTPPQGMGSREPRIENRVLGIGCSLPMTLDAFFAFMVPG